eukprot:3299768-Rhodomonas_salina.1
MLEESVHRPATLLSCTLYYACLVGVTPVWTKITGMTGPALPREQDLPESRDDEVEAEVLASLLDTLHKYL